MKVIAVYTDYEVAPVLFEEKDRAIANAYLKALGDCDKRYLETVETVSITLEEIAHQSSSPLVLVQKWATEDTEAERLQRNVERKMTEKAELEAKIAELQRQIEGL
jgi:hypothetical protein